MAVLKLTDAGQSHTGKIKTAQRGEGNFGPQVCLTFEDGNSVYLPEESADRQLNRIGYTVEELNEQASETAVWLKVHRQANPKKGAKPFWAIDKASGRAPAPPVPPSRTATPKPAAGRPPSTGSLTELYLDCVEFVLDEIVPRINGAAKVGLVGSPMQTADVVASAATLFINASKETTRPIFGPPSRAPKSFGDDPGPSDDDYPGDFEEAV